MNPPLNKTTTARLLAPAVWLLRCVGFLLRAVWRLFAAFAKGFFALVLHGLAHNEPDAEPEHVPFGYSGEQFSTVFDANNPSAVRAYNEYLDYLAREDDRES